MTFKKIILVTLATTLSLAPSTNAASMRLKVRETKGKKEQFWVPKNDKG